MKASLLKVLLLLLIVFFSTSASAALVMSIEDVNVPLDATTVSIDVNITGFTSEVVDSAGGKLILDSGLTFTGVTFSAPASSWGTQTFIPTPGLFGPSFGAQNTNFPLDTSYTADALPFATLSFDIDPSESAIFGNVLLVNFDTSSFLTEIADSLGNPLVATFDGGSITVVPIPPTILLLGAGLLSLVGIRRRAKS